MRRCHQQASTSYRWVERLPGSPEERFETEVLAQTGWMEDMQHAASCRNRVVGAISRYNVGSAGLFSGRVLGQRQGMECRWKKRSPREASGIIAKRARRNFLHALYFIAMMTWMVAVHPQGYRSSRRCRRSETLSLLEPMSCIYALPLRLS